MSVYARHGRFLIALGLGVAVYLGSWFTTLPGAERGLVAFDVFALGYLAMTFGLLGRVSTEMLRRKAETDDEGMPLIILLTMGAVGASLVAIWLVLAGRESDGLGLLLALAAVPLGWAAVHTVAAFHYAHLLYSPEAACRLEFPDEPAPQVWDFIYFAFVLGMTAQTSDVQIASVRMRKAVLAHSVASFFYNTVILALAVNAGAQLGG